MSLTALPIGSGDDALRVLPELRRALDGGHPLLPYAAGSPVPGQSSDAEPTPGTAVVVGTSGTTGAPKLAMLGADALRASASATHEVLGGPGQWLLSIPAHHIAGLQILVRSLHAGTTPVTMDLSAGFTSAGFAARSARLTGERRYVSLVPTQLKRLLDDRDGTAALTAYTAVLVGGAATPPALRHAAEGAGVNVVTTYGMSETAGGCVYDGRPLPVSSMTLDDGRILLGGATLATGYLGRADLTARAFLESHVARWFHTDDHGEVDPEGRLHVLGRLDDLVNSGGLKVAPRLVEEAIAEHLPEVAEAVVTGAPDPEWGEAVCATVVLRQGHGTVTLGEIRERLRGILPDHALPHRIRVVDDIPTTGPGKPDRARLRASFNVEQ